jgi:hypothetical protein
MKSAENSKSFQSFSDFIKPRRAYFELTCLSLNVTSGAGGRERERERESTEIED